MKVLLFMILSIFSLQSLAIELGYYECTTKFEDEEAGYGLIIESDRLEIYLDHSVPNDVFVLGRAKDPFKSKLITQDDSDQGIEAIQYKYYQQDVNTLRLITKMTWIDGETEVDLTISQINDEKLEVYKVETATGEKVVTVDQCSFQEMY